MELQSHSSIMTTARTAQRGRPRATLRWSRRTIRQWSGLSRHHDIIDSSYHQAVCSPSNSSDDDNNESECSSDFREEYISQERYMASPYPQFSAFSAESGLRRGGGAAPQRPGRVLVAGGGRPFPL